MWPKWREHKLFFVLTAVLMVYAVVWLGVSVQDKAASVKVEGRAPRQPATIIVDGEGKATGAPNIAKIDLGLLTEKATVQQAQAENSQKMNQLIDGVKQLGIDAQDIQTTQYQVFPQYDYLPGKTNLRGYSVSQSVNVKIRDLNKISAVLAKAGEVGANQVGGLQFTLDDEDSLRALARKAAIEKAQNKATDLAKALGVRLVRLTSFNESSPNSPGPIPYVALREGIGGAEAPQVQTGTVEVKVDVTLTYEIE